MINRPSRGLKNGPAALIAVALLIAFALSQLILPRPLTCWNAQLSIFYRNYLAFGHHFFPAYNFDLTNPPSNVYLSAGPLVTWMAYAAASVFGDRAMTYVVLMTASNVALLGLLYILVARRWGVGVASWTLFFTTLSKLALRWGDIPSFEPLSVVGIFAPVFLYFEWWDTGKTRWLALGIVAYLIGLAAHYLAAFGALVICLHWLVFAKHRTRDGLLKISTYPIVTIGFFGLLFWLMLASGYRLEDWLARAAARNLDSSWFDFLRTLIVRPLVYYGPGIVGAALVFPIIKHWGRKQPGNRAESSRDLAVLYSLLAAGLLPLIVFKDWYVVHDYSLFFLAPFLTVSTALAIDSLLSSRWEPLPKYGLLSAILLSFLALTLQGAMEHFGAPYPTWDDGRLEFTTGRRLTSSQRVHQLSLEVQPSVRPQDTLLVVYTGEDEFEICAFYALWIPTHSATSEEGESSLATEDFSLVLATDSRTSEILQDMGAEQLAADRELAYYRLR